MDSDMYDMDRLREPDEYEVQPGQYTFADASESAVDTSEPASAPEEPTQEQAAQPLELAAATSTDSTQQTDAEAKPASDVAAPEAAPKAPSGVSQGKASHTATSASTSNAKPEDTSQTEAVTYAGKAVIDRFEGKWAVLLVGENEEKSVSVKKSSLPKRVQAGHWLNVKLGGKDGDEVVSAEVDPEETARARQRIEEKLALLRSGTYREEDIDQKPPQS